MLHLEEVSKKLKTLNVKHKVIAGTYKGKGIKVSKRLERKQKFEDGKIRCLVVNKVMKKGIDIKRVDVIINAAGKPNTNDCIQIFGRGVRTHNDKTGLICFDIFDLDTRDKRRQKKNWLHKASKRRIRAYKKVGLTVKQIQYTEDISYTEVFKKAELWLQQEISKHENHN